MSSAVHARLMAIAQQAPRGARLVTTSVPLCMDCLRVYCPNIHTTVPVRVFLTHPEKPYTKSRK